MNQPKGVPHCTQFGGELHGYRVVVKPTDSPIHRPRGFHDTPETSGERAGIVIVQSQCAMHGPSL